MPPPFRLHLPALLWALLLAILLLVPGPQGPSTDWGWLQIPDFSDKVMHALLFGVAAWLFHRSLAAQRPLRPALAAAVAAAVIYGAALELLQGIPVLRRDPDFWDLVANTAGSCLYGGWAARWSRRRPRAPALGVPESEPLRAPALDGKMGKS